MRRGTLGVKDFNNKILEPGALNYLVLAECIKNGGVIIAPSDTNMVLIGNPWKAESINRIFQIKGKQFHTPLTLFFLEPDEWKDYAYSLNEQLVDSVTRHFWPGPLNIILKRRETVPSGMVCNMDTVSMGCISNPVWRELLKCIGMPIAMTSANLTGTADGILVDMELAAEQLGGQVDYILKGDSQGTTMSSTILDLTDLPVIVRQGDIYLDDILKVTGGIHPGTSIYRTQLRTKGLVI